MNHLKKGGFVSSSISLGSLNHEILVKACFCQNFKRSLFASSYHVDGALAFFVNSAEGGKGTRFWPLSRHYKPKQFLSILGDRSLLETTLSRVDGLASDQHNWILGSALHQDNLNRICADIDDLSILLEPCGRNTAACIAWGAFEALKQDPDAICVVLLGLMKKYLQREVNGRK